MLTTEWSFHLVDVTKNLGASMPGIDDDIGKMVVLTEDIPDSPALFSDAIGATQIAETAGIGVVTFRDGLVRFWTASTVTALDICGITADGRTFSFNSVTPSQHVIPVNPFHALQLAVIPFGPSVAETDTGLDLAINSLITVTDVKLRVTTADAARTLGFGLLTGEAGGNANGFMVGALMTTVGFVELLPQITGGTNIDFVGTRYIGDLLSTSIVGADAVATVGGFTPKVYRTDGVAKSLTYTGSAGTTTAAGYVYLSYRKLPF